MADDSNRSIDEDPSSYTGRWVARLNGRIVGQGGTPEQARGAARAARQKEIPKVEYVASMQPLNFSDLLERVAAVLPPDKQVFLVGGSVRDALLSRPVHDLDFVLSGDVLQFARRLGDRLGAAFFPLDAERDTARLVLRQEGETRQVLDFSAFRGPDLESDLRARDFTVNAMAVDVRNPQALLDPLGGAADLRQKLLRACSPESMQADPARVWRGIRLAAAYGFHILPETRAQMRQAAFGLASISPERLRDELFRILDGPQPVASIRALEMLGALEPVLPELCAAKGVEQSLPHHLDVWAHSLEAMQKLEAVLDALRPIYQQEAAANLWMGLVVLHLGRFREKIGDHLAASLTTERSLRALLLFAALYHDVGKPESQTHEESGRIRFFGHEQAGEALIRDRARSLRLNNVEVDRLSDIVRHHLRPILLAQADQLPSRRAVYRFFRDTGPAGVDICLLSLADVMATYMADLPTQAWVRHLEVVRTLLEAWWEHPDQSISPPTLITGRDLLDHFSLQPGPLIGRLLEEVREAQAEGSLGTREEAIHFVQELLDKNDPVTP